MVGRFTRIVGWLTVVSALFWIETTLVGEDFINAMVHNSYFLTRMIVPYVTRENAELFMQILEIMLTYRLIEIFVFQNGKATQE